MAKLQDLFTQARRAQSGGGIGFLGKKTESKPHAASLVIEFPTITPGSAESALKAGADGLIFTWDGKDTTVFETLKKEIDSARTSNQDVVTGLHITGGWDKLDRDTFATIKEQGIQYLLLPFNAPARLLAWESKELEKVVTVPMRSGELYPLFIRNLTALEGISAVLLDFGFDGDLGSLSIEDILQYNAVREAVRFPAFLNVKDDLNEADSYTLQILGIQAVILTADNKDATTQQRIKNLRTLLEKTYREEKDQPAPTLRK